MKYKVALINVYFGKLPKWFQLWLDSCRNNSEFTWLIFTDDNSEYNYPNNVIRHLTTLGSIKKRIIEKINVSIKVDNPYKLCDFKTVYGNIFDDYLLDYTHWGYCDLDMIFGDISKFITDDILEKYERILNKGHLTIYKNNEKVKKYYKLPYNGPSYKEIFESKYHYGFDEVSGLDILYKENMLSQWIPTKNIIADINFSNYRLEINRDKNYKYQYFSWEEGRVLRHYILNGKEAIDEYAYIHFQKRNLVVNIYESNKILFTPREIVDIECIKNIYKENENVWYEQFKRKLLYLKIIIKQKVYRFLHLKLKI